LKKLEADTKKPESERRPPEFGSAKDFQLNQALNQLKGLPVKVSTTLAELKDTKKDK
jgi:carboxyl-terminal processing protease